MGVHTARVATSHNRCNYLAPASAGACLRSRPNFPLTACPTRHRTYPVPTATFRWANVQCGGNLAELIATMTDDGLSPDKIAARLYADHGVDVTGRTIARWLPSVLTADDGPSAA